ncbi:MAG: restriction endonuclease [Bacteroidia bacterium]|nr:restriction endonuclease [Bacteroidia bacterium]
MTAGVSGYLGYGGTAWVFLGGNNESVYRKSYLSGLHALAKGKTMGDAREAINRAWIHMAQNRTARYLDRICAFNHAQDLYLLGDSAVQLVSSPIFWTSVPVDGVVEEPRVEIVDVSSDFIAWVQEDPQRVHFLSPDKFEELIADRLEAMNFCVEQIGTTFRSDGGIDLIAYPEVSPVPFLLAIQIKHSRSGRPVGSTTVRDFQGALINLPIDVGMIVTNTRFTPHARWFAERRSRIIRLRDFEDLRQWLQGQFSSDSLLEELPEELELLPGLTVRIPRPLR